MRLTYLFTLAVALPFFASCGSALKIVSGNGYLGGRSTQDFKATPPSSALIAAASAKPKDKHSMPVYSFSERHRVVRTTAYTCSEDDRTVFRVKGMPELYVVDDYGSALTGTGTIDMYQPSKELMNRWGRRNVEISVVQWGSFNRSVEILSARTKHQHCRQMLANITRQRPDLAKVATR